MRVNGWISALGLAAVATALSPSLEAQERRALIDVESYSIEAEVNPRTQSVSATATVRFLPLEQTTYSVVFELNNAMQVSKVVDEAGQALSASRLPREQAIRLNFTESLPRNKPATVIFTYDGRLTGEEESPVYGIKFGAIHNDYAYLLYPARWFPVNGYTADRYAMKLRVTVPGGYKVISSGLGTQDTAAGDKIVYEFHHERPSFPGSLAVVQGDAVRVSSQGVTTEVFFRGDNASMAGRYGEETGKVMAFLTDKFGLPPQANLTLVETETGAPNGYSAPGILFVSSRGIGKEVNTRLLANQIARQWWGTLVSPVDRNHIWITNGAARYAELMWVEHVAGKAAFEGETRDVYVEALTVDDVPVIQSSRLEDYSPEYWAVTAAKGSAILNMLRYIAGEEAFTKLLKEFPAAHAWQPVSTEDMRKASEAVTGRDLRGFFLQWIESSGAPEFKLEYTVFRTQKGFRTMGKIAQDLDTFRMPVELRIETEGNPETSLVEVVGTSSEFVVESFGRPKRVVIDPDQKVLRFSDRMRVAVAIRRGEMFAEISEFGEALKEYQKALDVNRNSSLAHYRVAEVFLLQRNYQSAANEFRAALDGDLDPKWTEVWSHIKLGNIFDITGQRERAVNEYNLALRTKDNTQGAQEEAARYLKQPYERSSN